jgi:hypothetical protein
MKRFVSAWWGWLSVALALFSGIAVLTNPGLDQHRYALHMHVRQTMEERIKANHAQDVSNKIGLNLGGIFWDAILVQMLENSVHRQNWGLCSVTQFSVDGKQLRVGVGLFGHIWISSRFDDALRKELSLLRGVEVGDLPMDAFALPNSAPSDSIGL